MCQPPFLKMCGPDTEFGLERIHCAYHVGQVPALPVELVVE